MRKLTYNGKHEAVEIAATGQLVENGATVEIEDDDIADALLAAGNTIDEKGKPKDGPGPWSETKSKSKSSKGDSE